MQRLASTLTLFALSAAPAQAQWSTATLSSPVGAPAAATVGGRAFFAGGAPTQTGTGNAVVDIYDPALGAPGNLTAWSTAALSVGRTEIAATVLGDLLFFAGGATTGYVPSAVVDVYDAQTNSWSVVSLSQARTLIAATSIGTKAIFAGGSNAPSTASAVVDIYDSALGLPSNPLAWSTTTLSGPRAFVTAASVGSKALFACGFDFLSASGSNVVDVYDDATGVWSTTTLGVGRALSSTAAITCGSRAYFPGGQTTLGGAVTGQLDIYDALTDSWSSATLPHPRGWIGSAVLGNTILFGCGRVAGGGITGWVDVLNATTGTWLPSLQCSQVRTLLGVTSVAGKAMFAGGVTGPGAATSVIDVYEAGGAPTSFCFGDGSAAACPCGNNGLAGRGCENSGLTGGAVLGATGFPSLSSDSLMLTSSGELPSVLSIFLQGSVSNVPVPFGEGLRCTGGSLKRLYTHNASGGVVSAPQGSDLSVSARSAALGDVLGAGSTRFYQTYYRDPVLTFCNGTGFNVSSGLAAIWGM